MLITLRATAALIKKAIAPQRTIKDNIIEWIIVPKSTALKMLKRYIGNSDLSQGYSWRFARKDELYLFSRWSDEDESIGAMHADRLRLYENWFAANPNCFALLLEDGLPIGCSIVIPLNNCGVDILSQDATSALNIRSSSISQGMANEVLADTLVAGK